MNADSMAATPFVELTNENILTTKGPEIGVPNPFALVDYNPRGTF